MNLETNWQCQPGLAQINNGFSTQERLKIVKVNRILSEKIFSILCSFQFRLKNIPYFWPRKDRHLCPVILLMMMIMIAKNMNVVGKL